MPDDSYNKILVVEDDVAFFDQLNVRLSAAGFVVANAENGEQAMEKLLFHQPKLVILDLMLPKVDGFHVLEKIRSYPEPAIANTPVFILSNLSSEADIERAQKLKISHYFVKSQTSTEEVVTKAEETVFGSSITPKTHFIDFTTSQ